MPMAKKKPSTVARLAMGTAILTVISGCENRVGQGISGAISPVAASVAQAPVVVTETLTPVTQAVARAPGVVLETLVPSTTAVVEPEYVVPGAPTYSESSQAANVQTFEAIYGKPVSTDPSDAMASAQTYAIPSYDDGAVIAQPLPAPAPTYTQQVTAAVAQTYETMPDSAAGFVYGDTLTSESYAVIPDPVIGEVATVGTFGMTEAVTVDPFMSVPAETVPLATETYTIDSMPTYAPDAMIVEPAPLPMTDTGTAAPMLSYDEAFPMTDASAGFFVPPEPLGFEAAPGTMPAATGIYAPAMQDAMPVPGGVEIIGNDEAEATYGATAPAMDADERTETAIPPVVFETFYEAPVRVAPVIETAALAATPLPSRKQARSAPSVVPAPTVAAAIYGPLTAPLPRRRPAHAAERSYATLDTPLPQPRPDYGNPVAAATTSGAYVSIGSLPPVETMDMAPDMAPQSEPAPVAIQAASVKKTEETGSQSELSGTSWRLSEVGGEAVTVNTELHFDGSSGFAGGQGPCNSYGGQFVNTGKGRFSMANLFSTDTSCPTIGIEERYLDALKNADSYEITPGFSGMTLLDDDGEPIVRFEAF